MENWREFGYTPSKAELIESFGLDSDDSAEELYIESRRYSYYYEYCLYVRDNGDSHFYY